MHISTNIHLPLTSGNSASWFPRQQFQKLEIDVMNYGEKDCAKIYWSWFSEGKYHAISLKIHAARVDLS